MIALACAYPDEHLHHIDLPYRLSSPPLERPAAAAMWHDEQGALAAWAVLQTPFWSIDTACRPACRCSLRRADRRWFPDLAGAAGVEATIVHCHAPDSVLRARIAARTAARNDASEAGLEVLALQPGYWEPFEAGETARVAAVDTSEPAAVAALLDRLAPRGAA